MCVCVRERACAHNTHIHTHRNISHPCVWVRTSLCIHAFINIQLHREKRFPQLIRELRGILHASAACCTSCSSDDPQPGVDPAEASVVTASASHSAVASHGPASGSLGRKCMYLHSFQDISICPPHHAIPVGPLVYVGGACAILALRRNAHKRRTEQAGQHSLAYIGNGGVGEPRGPYAPYFTFYLAH